jgi:AAA15 family ATPase/GTPase
MTFKEKIDKILETNTLGINSVTGLEDFLTAGRGAINDFYKVNKEPGRKTLKRIKGFPNLNVAWYETGKGDIYLSNPTDERIGSNNKQKQLMTPRETFYIDLIEKNEEYNLIPRAVLKDYKIVPDKIIDVIIQSNENEKKALVEGLNSKYELMIQGYKNKIADLESEINRLRNR